MRQRLTGVVTNIRSKWNEMEMSNRIKLVIAVAAVVIVLGAMIVYAVRPRYEVVYQGLNVVDGMDGIALLRAEGIPAEFKNGEILVREADLQRAAFVLTTSDLTALNKPDTSFADAMDLLSMGQTSAIQRDVMLHQKQSEIENSLKMFDGVVSAKMNIVLADESRAFLRSEQRSSVSVILTTNKDLTSADGQAMARYICKSLKGLTMEEIEITNQNFQYIYSGTKVSSDGISEAYDIELMKKNEIAQMVRSFVGPMYTDVSVIVNLTMNFDRIIQQIRAYEDPNTDRNTTGFPINEQTSQTSVTGAETAGEVGLGANDQQAPGYQMGQQAPVEASTKDQIVNYVFNESFTETEMATGVVDYTQSSLSVRLTDVKNYYEEDLPAYLEEAGLPEDTEWRQFKNTIVEFVQNPVTPEIDTLRESIRIGTNIPNVDIITYTQSVFFDIPATETPIQNYVMFFVLILLILLLLYGFIKKTQEDEITEVEPELSVEDLLVSSQLEEQKEEAAEKQLQAIAFTQDNEAMRQIENFINERPEAVAALLRNWINEDWE